MAHCEEYTELISAALDGALSPIQQEKLDAHLASCPDCAALFRELSALHAALETLPPVEPPAELKARIMDAVAAEQVLSFPTPKKKGFSRQGRRWLATAAMLALVIAGAWSWKPWERKDITGQQPAPAAGDARFSPAPAEMGGLTTGADQASASQSSAPVGTAEETPLPEIAPQDADPREADATLNDTEAALTPHTMEKAAPEAVPAPANAAPAPKLGRSMVIDGGNALEESVPEVQMAAILPEEEGSESPETQDVTALQAPALFFAPIPSDPPEENSGEVPAPLMVGASLSDAPAESPELTSRQALDLLLEAYPMPEGAQLLESEAYPGWQTPLTTAEGEIQQVSTRLEYLGLTANGKYHEFWLHNFLVDDPGTGLAHSSTLNFFAVPLDGGEVLVQRTDPAEGLPEEEAMAAYEAGVQAYLEATTE